MAPSMTIVMTIVMPLYMAMRQWMGDTRPARTGAIEKKAPRRPARALHPSPPWKNKLRASRAPVRETCPFPQTPLGMSLKCFLLLEVVCVRHMQSPPAWILGGNCLPRFNFPSAGAPPQRRSGGGNGQPSFSPKGTICPGTRQFARVDNLRLN